MEKLQRLNLLHSRELECMDIATYVINKNGYVHLLKIVVNDRYTLIEHSLHDKAY